MTLTLTIQANIRCWNGSFNRRKKKPTIQSNYNRKIDSLCILLCDRLSQIATALCENLEIQVNSLESKLRVAIENGSVSVIYNCIIVYIDHKQSQHVVRLKRPTAARLAQLGERRSAEREAVGSNPGRTNTQGL